MEEREMNVHNEIMKVNARLIRDNMLKILNEHIGALGEGDLHYIMMQLIMCCRFIKPEKDASVTLEETLRTLGNKWTLKTGGAHER